jgi:hypothetical protein
MTYMTINDILALGKMGFTAQQVQQMLSLERAQQGQPITAPAQSAAPATTPAAPATTPAAQQPVTPDPMAAMAQQIADLTAAINAKNVPTAGTVGNPAPVTSVEDIILGLVQPAEAPASPDFNAVK